MFFKNSIFFIRPKFLFVKIQSHISLRAETNKTGFPTHY